MSKILLASMVIGVSALILISPVFNPHPASNSTLFNDPPPTQEETLFQNSDFEAEQQTRTTYEQLRLRDPATGVIPPGIRQRELDFSKNLPRRSPAFYSSQKNPAKFEGWVSRGPDNIGGRVRALAFDLSDPTYNTIFAGGVSGGMWRTTNDGESWIKVTAPWQLHSVSCVVQDTRINHQNVWYYGTGEGRASSPSQGGDIYRGDGIFKSVDGGLNWSLLPATSTNTPQETDQPFNFVWNMAINPVQPDWDEVFAATAGLIYRSQDGGDSWVPVLGDPEQLALYTDIAVTSDGVFYAGISTDGGTHGVFRSVDGEVWTDITPAWLTNYTRIVLSIAPGNENYLFVTTSQQDGGFYTGLHRYQYISGDGTNNGGTWINRSPSLTQMPHPYYGTYPYNTQRGYNQGIAVQPGELNNVFLGGVHLWRSTNGFSNDNEVSLIGGWTVSDHHADVHQMIFQPGSDQVVYTASDGGVHKTLDITSGNVDWISLNNGLRTTQFYTVAIDEEISNNNIIAGGTQDNGTLWSSSDDDSLPWATALGGDGADCVVVDGRGLFGAPTEYYLSWYFGNMLRVFLFSDGSESQSTAVKPIGLENQDFLFINPFIIDPNEESIMYLATLNGVWRNDDLTEIPMGSFDPTSINWVHLSTQPADEHVSALAISRSENRILYYGMAEGGGLYRIDGANTAPAGTPPTPLHQNADFPANAFVSAITIHPDDDQKVLVAYANYLVESLWYTEDGGSSWVNVEGNLAGADGPSIRAAQVVPLQGTDYWFIGTSTGVYSTVYSEGSPVVWELEADELIGNVIVNALATRPADGLLVAATFGLGIFSTTISPLSDVPTTVSTINLAQNSPNPFNPQTTISYTLGSDERISLRIFDVAGRLIRVLRNDVAEEAGRHQVVWNGRDNNGRAMPSGTFLYRLNAGSFSESKSMTLVR